MMRRFGALGLEVKISEIDVARRGDRVSDEALARIQAAYFGGALEACLALPAVCTGYTIWGTHDELSWYFNRPGFPAPEPLLFMTPRLRVYDPDAGRCTAAPRRITNQEYCPKSGYRAIRQVFENRLLWKVWQQHYWRDG
jgi:GH35 family endo-1,4-beta-xylanase